MEKYYSFWNERQLSTQIYRSIRSGAEDWASCLHIGVAPTSIKDTQCVSCIFTSKGKNRSKKTFAANSGISQGGLDLRSKTNKNTR